MNGWNICDALHADYFRNGGKRIVNRTRRPTTLFCFTNRWSHTSPLQWYELGDSCKIMRIWPFLEKLGGVEPWNHKIKLNVPKRKPWFVQIPVANVFSWKRLIQWKQGLQLMTILGRNFNVGVSVPVHWRIPGCGYIWLNNLCSRCRASFDS